MQKKPNVNSKGARHLYAMLVVFASLEEAKTSTQLVELLNARGFDYGIRTVQRMLVALKEVGFPVECKRASVIGKATQDYNPYYWQWSAQTNIDDNIMQAKSLIVLEKFKEAA